MRPNCFYVPLQSGIKKPGFITSNCKLGEERPGLRCKGTKNMEYNKIFLEKDFHRKEKKN